MEEDNENINLDIIDFNNNNIEYKGQFGGDDNEEELPFYEYGAHFKYRELYTILEHLANTKQERDGATNATSHLEQKPNKHIANSIIQSRNINNNYNINKQGCVAEYYKGSDKNVKSFANERIKLKTNHTFGTKTNNNIIIHSKRAPALSGNKNKNIVSKHSVKKTMKFEMKNIKNKIQTSNANNNINLNSQSNSKPKNNNNNIKSISNKKQISTISTNTNVEKPSTKHQQKLSSSYQNLCLNKIISPPKKITQGIISNIKYKKVNTNPSLNKKQHSPPNSNQTEIKKNQNLKSRNANNDILTQNTKGLKDNNNNNNNINLFHPSKKPKKEEDKQSLTYQHINNNDEHFKPIVNGLISKNKNAIANKASSHSKAKNEIIGIVIKQKPHSQERPNNIFHSNIIKNVTTHITKKNNSSNPKQPISKPQSANIACSVITSIKKGNSLTNRKISPPSATQTLCNKHSRPNTNQSKQKRFLKKAVINNITTIHIPLQERFPSSGSKHKKIHSRNLKHPQVTKTTMNVNTCGNNINNKQMNAKNTRPVSNSNKHTLSIGKHVKQIGKGSINIKLRQVQGNSNNSNKKGSVHIGRNEDGNGKAVKGKKEKSVNVNNALNTEPKIDMDEFNSCPIDIKYEY